MSTYLSPFIDLGVPAQFVNTLADLGVTRPTPIQRETLPDSLTGRDVLGRARTGSGKTLAFLLPIVCLLSDEEALRPRAPRAVILAPTRELVAQIDTALRPIAAVSRLTSLRVFGGVGQGPQVDALRRGVDIVVACPGRLEDLISQGHCSLEDVRLTVLDEADHMADLGFLPAVRRLLQGIPKDGQRLLFSATLDDAVDGLVREFLHDPVVRNADPGAARTAVMAHHVLAVRRDARVPVLADFAHAAGRMIVFTRTKHGAKALSRQLNARGVVSVELHGNLSQNARSRNLADFDAGRASTLVATDIAARGIHVDDVTLVVHADPPADSKAYLHRAGRTSRAGKQGSVVTLVTGDQLAEVRNILRAAGVSAEPGAAQTDPRLVLASICSDPLHVRLAPRGPKLWPDMSSTAPAGASVGRTRARRRRHHSAAGDTNVAAVSR